MQSFLQAYERADWAVQSTEHEDKQMDSALYINMTKGYGNIQNQNIKERKKNT